jgi:hypothetical protein
MDAQLNRERILEVAKRRSPGQAQAPAWTTSLNRPVLEREPCIATFRTRDTLLEAVYRTEVEKLAAAERKLAQDLPPIEAFRAWMLLVSSSTAGLLLERRPFWCVCGPHHRWTVEEGVVIRAARILLPSRDAQPRLNSSAHRSPFREP